MYEADKGNISKENQYEAVISAQEFSLLLGNLKFRVARQIL